MRKTRKKKRNTSIEQGYLVFSHAVPPQASFSGSSGKSPKILNVFSRDPMGLQRLAHRMQRRAMFYFCVCSVFLVGLRPAHSCLFGEMKRFNFVDGAS